MRISQRKKAPPDFRSSAKAGDPTIKLIRKRSSQHQSRQLLPKRSDQEPFFRVLLPSLSDHPFPNSYTMKIFDSFVHLFVLLWPRKVMPLFTHLRPRQRVSTQPPGDLDLPRCWRFSSSACHKLLQVPMPHFLWARLSHLSVVSDSLPVGPTSLSLVNHSGPGELCVLALYKERDTRQG